METAHDAAGIGQSDSMIQAKMTLDEYADRLYETKRMMESYWNYVEIQAVLIGLFSWPPWMARVYAEVDERA
jgi:hypothetical protein